MIFVLPADVADPELPSGGNTYDQRVVAGLRSLGHAVDAVLVDGAWPRPGAAACAALDRVLTAADGLVVVDGLVACGVPEVVVPHARRVRLVVLVHMPLGAETGAAAGLDARERAVLRAAWRVVTTSDRAARELERRHGVRGVRVVAPGTDAAPLAAGDPRELLCVASLTPHKGQDVLVRALAEVADLEWTCTLAGPVRRSPAFAERVRTLVAEHGLDARVRMPGPLTGERLERAYGAAGLLVLPSRSETYGMVVAEALARGIPVLASAGEEALGRAPDGSVPGLLVPPGDVVALASGLREWLTTPSWRLALRRSARLRRAEQADWNHAARAMATALTHR